MFVLGELFCDACRKEISLKLSSIKDHIASVSHKAKVKALKDAILKQADVAAFVEVP
jgi:hypothetical protein